MKSATSRAPLRVCGAAMKFVVVDSGSADRTRDIAQRLGARVIEQPWLGYAAQKNFAAEQASSDWILSLDADEALSENPGSRDLGAGNGTGRAMTPIPCRAWRSTWAGGFYIAAGIRTVKCGFTTAQRHAGPANLCMRACTVEGAVGALDEKLLHFTCDSLSEHLLTLDRYTTSSRAGKPSRAGGGSRDQTGLRAARGPLC